MTGKGGNMEENKTVGKSCCIRDKAPFFVGLLGFLFVCWVLLAAADKIGLGVSSIFSKRNITVTGSSTRQQANQLASFNATVSNKNADKATAVSDVTKKSEKLIADLKQFGIADKDLKTQSLNIYRDQVAYYVDGGQQFRDGDWNASISVDITLRDISKSSGLTDLLAKSETSNIYGPSYSLNEGESDKTELLKNAFDSAKAKAESLAAGMGMKVGKVVNVVEGADYGSPVYSLKGDGMGGGGGMEPGSSNVSTTLTVTFELK
jgi:uncharacterized protein